MAFGGFYPTHYRGFLVDVCMFGKGVFALPMVHEPDVRNSLRVFINRNPKLFRSYTGRRGDVAIKVVTKKGYLRVGVGGKPTASENWYSLLDYLVVNSFLHETGILQKYSMNPRFFEDVSGKMVGQFSLRWGINDLIVSNSDYIIGPPISVLGNIETSLKAKIEEKYVVPKGIERLKKGLFGGQV